MAATKRATVSLEPQLHRGLRLKAAETGMNVSRLINDAIRTALAEDTDNLAALRGRAKEPARPFEDFLKELRHDGLL